MLHRPQFMQTTRLNINIVYSSAATVSTISELFSDYSDFMQKNCPTNYGS